jgi:hypothetical protein
MVSGLLHTETVVLEKRGRSLAGDPGGGGQPYLQ